MKTHFQIWEKLQGGLIAARELRTVSYLSDVHRFEKNDVKTQVVLLTQNANETKKDRTGYIMRKMRQSSNIEPIREETMSE
jgi:hypothetical protein